MEGWTPEVLADCGLLLMREPQPDQCVNPGRVLQLSGSWYLAGFGVPSADTVLDRLVHYVHRIELKRESLRRMRAARAVRLDETAGSRRRSGLQTTPPPGSLPSECLVGFDRNKC